MWYDDPVMAIADSQTGSSPAVRRSAIAQQELWQQDVADSIRDLAELCRFLDLPPGLTAGGEAAARDFPLLVPRPFASRMRRGDPQDPLLRQILPSHAEMRHNPRFSVDPLNEGGRCVEPGVLWKYPGRLLIVTTPACGVHCRYCFRRHFTHHQPGGIADLASSTAQTQPLVGLPGGSLKPSAQPTCTTGAARPDRWQGIATRIEREPSIHEVILSGGDPLRLDDTQLKQAVGKLAEISQLKRLRLHTRMPVAIPNRVTDDLLTMLRGSRLACWVVIQVNHPREIDDRVATAIGRLIDAGVPVLNQSVLLRGVNDDLEPLAELFERLADLRVVPYYLHQLDRVAGAANFEVGVAQGRQLIKALRHRLPGYAVPRYVCEKPGARSKTPLD